MMIIIIIKLDKAGWKKAVAVMCWVFVQELSQLRVAKVTGGAASKLSKM